MNAQQIRSEWYTVEQVILPDGPATLARAPGVVGLGPADAAMFTALRRIPAGALAVLGPGSTPTALWAVRSGATVQHIADSIAETVSLATSLTHNHLAGVSSLPDWRTDLVEAASCDLALLHLPRGRDHQQHLIQLAGALLVPGGRLVFVGATREGVKGAVKAAAQLLGRAGVVARKGGYHAAIAYRPAHPIELPETTFESHAIAVDGESTELVACAGAFAPDRLDGGAEALIAGMQITPGSRVLDLGCGTGLVTLAAARRGADVVATDVSARAVASAQRTLAANSRGEVVVHWACGAAPIADGTIDTVVTNPPFHSGHDVNFDVSRLFVREARRVLKPGGQVFLVANRGLDYGRWLREAFGSAGTAFETPRFRVWTAVA